MEVGQTRRIEAESNMVSNKVNKKTTDNNSHGEIKPIEKDKYNSNNTFLIHLKWVLLCGKIIIFFLLI